MWFSSFFYCRSVLVCLVWHGMVWYVLTKCQAVRYGILHVIWYGCCDMVWSGVRSGMVRSDMVWCDIQNQGVWYCVVCCTILYGIVCRDMVSWYTMYIRFSYQPLNNFSNLLVRKAKFLSFKKLWSRQIMNLKRTNINTFKIISKVNQSHFGPASL